jgi:ATP-dependent Lon protease
MKPKSVARLFSVFGGKAQSEEFPLLPLRDLVLFPQTVIPLFITYPAGIHAVDAALSRDLRLFTSCLKALPEPGAGLPAPGNGGSVPSPEGSFPPGQDGTGPQNTGTGFPKLFHNPKTRDAGPEHRFPPPPFYTGSGGGDTYGAGTVVRIIQHLKLPDNTYRVVLQGEYRATIKEVLEQKGYALVRVEPVSAQGAGDLSSPEVAALARTVQKSFAQYAEFSRKVGTETLSAVDRTESPERLVNLIANALGVKAEKKVALLAMDDTRTRMEMLLEILETENEIYGIQKNISGKVKSRMEKSQREYYLHEQLKEINKELGKENTEDEYADLERAIEERHPPQEILVKARKELGRLRKLQSFSPEAGVLRGYLEWIAELPWGSYSTDSGDLTEAERILNEDHFGMKKVKERILEFIAVRELSSRNPAADGSAGVPEAGDVFIGAAAVPADAALPGEPASETALPVPEDSPPERGKQGTKGPILCFVGPPGTGKTSLGQSVARALGRRFVRISLGGVRDEAEIRGHRKTYVGALPGKIIQSIRKAESSNPVFLLDEIDKLSSDIRGDPASALLEVLDPEQNATFTDHYLEVPYDLSKVLFIATANSLETIPYALLDRMEIIEVPGYGEREKLAIAQQFLVPRELKENGLTGARISFRDEAILELIRRYTMESGVRSLGREIARCIRRIAQRAVVKGYGKDADKPVDSFKKMVHKEDLEKILGRRKYKNDLVYREARVGVSYGLAWTENGGAILPVETIRFEGHGDLIMTGNLGDVMKESARIALSWLRSAGDRYKYTITNIGKSDFHIHVPEGAIPKDGPSAGITLAASLLSTLCGAAPKPAIAMTGELTLTGRVLPIGGLKEKLLAAIRNGMETVLLPADNKEDWEELDKEIKHSLKAEFVETADEAFGILFDAGIHRITAATGKTGPHSGGDPAGARVASGISKR